MSDTSLPSMQFQDPKINLAIKEAAEEEQKISKSTPNFQNQPELEPLYVDGVPDPLDEEPDIKYILPFLKFY
ncbi:hypothetical protein M9Y10_020203 [Tritrichomonas musculus]|uniref:Uncharacterized protein n=1 Tax=Tritrichomonas musculus TaxID=1915356 RepID=A0ABR2HHT5_9EUKA